MEKQIPIGIPDKSKSNEYAVAGMTAYEDKYCSNLTMPAHAHERAGLYFILEGSLSETCRKSQHLIEESTLVIHPPGEIHSDHFYERGRVFQIELDAQWVDHIHQHSDILASPG